MDISAAAAYYVACLVLILPNTAAGVVQLRATHRNVTRASLRTSCEETSVTARRVAALIIVIGLAVTLVSLLYMKYVHRLVKKMHIYIYIYIYIYTIIGIAVFVVIVISVPGIIGAVRIYRLHEVSTSISK